MMSCLHLGSQWDFTNTASGVSFCISILLQPGKQTPRFSLSPATWAGRSASAPPFLPHPPSPGPISWHCFLARASSLPLGALSFGGLNSLLYCPLLSFFLPSSLFSSPSFPFFGCIWSMQKFPGQESNPSHICNLPHSCGNADSLTHCTTAGTLPLHIFWTEFMDRVFHAKTVYNNDFLNYYIIWCIFIIIIIITKQAFLAIFEYTYKEHKT